MYPLLLASIDSRRRSSGPEFGTNTGRQGIFDPNDPTQSSAAIDRLQALYSQYGNKLQPGFTGKTGLRSNDAQGYSDWLNAITEAQNISRIFNKKEPLQVRYGGEFPADEPDRLGIPDEPEGPMSLRRLRGARF